MLHLFKRFRKIAVLTCALACLTGANSVHAQSLFYNNSVDDNFYDPAGVEIAMPVAFTGAYEVDSFTFGYFLPLNSLNGPTTDAIVNFYTAAQPDGDAYSGYDPVQGYFPNLVSSTRLTNLPSDPTGATNKVSFDLTTFGDFFEWDAMPLDTGETGGWISIQFTNPDAGWELATGDSQDDVFQDMTNGGFFDFGGTPQAAFYVQLYGQNLTPSAVPEPGTGALMTGLFIPGCLVYLRRRRRLLPSGR